MNGSSAAKLYTPDLLGLAVQLAGYPSEPAFGLKGEARSRTCGSRIEIDLSLGDDGRIQKIGMRVTACAVGQAAAAIFANAAEGETGEGVAAALHDLENWLSGTGILPCWPGLSALSPARDHAGRHGAILLPWKAAAAALCKAGQAG